MYAYTLKYCSLVRNTGQRIIPFIIFQCEEIVDEFEDSMISLFARKEKNVRRQLCTNETKLCNPTDFTQEDDENIEESDVDEEHDEL